MPSSACLESHRMEPGEYDDILRTLVRIAAHHDVINDRLTAAIEQCTAAIGRLDVTQARIATLLARMIGGRENGQEP